MGEEVKRVILSPNVEHVFTYAKQQLEPLVALAMRGSKLKINVE